MIGLNDLLLQNPWWRKGKVPKVFLGRERREFYQKIKKFMPLRQALLFYGLRRTGKTTFLYQFVQKFLDKGITPEKLFYFSFDEKIASLKELLEIYELRVLQSKIDETTQFYLFLDEIQKLKDWQDQVKLIYDRYPSLKIFLSGSVSVSLQKEARESLAGRVFEFEFEPLSFKEFLEWKGFSYDKKRLDFYSKDLNILAQEYLFKGGFPEITEEKDKEVVRLYLKSSVIGRILEQDLPFEFGLRDLELLKTLAELFFTNPGMILNYEKLASDLQRSKVTVINYVFYLKYALLLREVKNFRASLRAASRKNKKIYPYNPAFCFVYLPEKEVLMEKVLETAVAAFLKAKYYYRNRFKVDFVLKKGGELVPVEVKFGKVEISQVEKFQKKFWSRKGLIISQDYEGKKKGIEILPFWKALVQGIKL